MEMDRTEIVSSYREAKDKRSQLGVLAELNLCGKDEIACLLLEAGEKVDGRWYASRGESRPGRAAKWEDGAVMLSRAEAELLREYLEATLPGWFRVLDVEKILTPDAAAAQLLRVNVLTGIWKKLPGGDA